MILHGIISLSRVHTPHHTTLVHADLKNITILKVHDTLSLSLSLFLSLSLVYT